MNRSNFKVLEINRREVLLENVTLNLEIYVAM